MNESVAGRKAAIDELMPLQSRAEAAWDADHKRWREAKALKAANKPKPGRPRKGGPAAAAGPVAGAKRRGRPRTNPVQADGPIRRSSRQKRQRKEGGQVGQEEARGPRLPTELGGHQGGGELHLVTATLSSPTPPPSTISSRLSGYLPSPMPRRVPHISRCFSGRGRV